MNINWQNIHNAVKTIREAYPDNPEISAEIDSIKSLVEQRFGKIPANIFATGQKPSANDMLNKFGGEPTPDYIAQKPMFDAIGKDAIEPIGINQAGELMKLDTQKPVSLSAPVLPKDVINPDIPTAELIGRRPTLEDYQQRYRQDKQVSSQEFIAQNQPQEYTQIVPFADFGFKTVKREGNTNRIELSIPTTKEELIQGIINERASQNPIEADFDQFARGAIAGVLANLPDFSKLAGGQLSKEEYESLTSPQTGMQKVARGFGELAGAIAGPFKIAGGIVSLIPKTAVKTAVGKAAIYTGQQMLTLGIANALMENQGETAKDIVENKVKAFIDGIESGVGFGGVGSISNTALRIAAMSIYMGVPSSMRGETTEEQVYNYLLGAYFGRHGVDKETKEERPYRLTWDGARQIAEQKRIQEIEANFGQEGYVGDLRSKASEGLPLSEELRDVKAEEVAQAGVSEGEVVEQQAGREAGVTAEATGVEKPVAELKALNYSDEQIAGMSVPFARLVVENEIRADKVDIPAVEPATPAVAEKPATQPQKPAEAVKPAEATTKQPWEMTRAEFNGGKRPLETAEGTTAILPLDINGKVIKINSEVAWSTGAKAESVAKGKVIDIKVIPRETPAGKPIGINLYEVKIVTPDGKTIVESPNRLYDPKEVPNVWMRRDDSHIISINRALSEGKPVPAEVLADYPDLAAKYGTPAVKEATAEKPVVKTPAIDTATETAFDALVKRSAGKAEKIEVLNKKADDIFAKFVESSKKTPSGFDPEQIKNLVEYTVNRAQVAGLKLSQAIDELYTKSVNAGLKYTKEELTDAITGYLRGEGIAKEAKEPAVKEAVPAEATKVAKEPFVVDDEGKIAKVVDYDKDGNPIVIYPGKTGGMRPKAPTVVSGDIGLAGSPYRYVLTTFRPANVADFNKVVKPGGSEKLMDLRRWKDEQFNYERAKALPKTLETVKGWGKENRRRIIEERLKKGQDVGKTVDEFPDLKEKYFPASAEATKAQTQVAKPAKQPIAKEENTNTPMDMAMKEADTIITSVKNRVQEEKRAELGLPAIEKGATRPGALVEKEAIELVESGKVNPMVLAEELLKEPRAVSDTESHILSREGGRLNKEYNLTLDAIIDAQKRGVDERAVNLLKLQLDYLREQYDIVSEADAIFGTEAGRSLASRRWERDLNTLELLPLQKRAKVALGVDTLSKEFEKKLENISQQYRDLQKRLDEVEALRLKEQAERIISEEAGKEAKKATYKKRIADKKAEFKSFADELIKLSEGRLSANIDPQAVVLMGKMTKNLIEQGVIKVEEVVDTIYTAAKERYTKREIMEAISGYGMQKESKQKHLSQLTELRKQMKLIIQIEDAKKGLRPLKPKTAEHIAKSKEIADLEKQLNESLLEQGIDIKNESKASRSIKQQITALDKQIADYENALQTGKIIDKKVTTPAVTNAKIQELKQNRAKLQSEYNAKFAQQLGDIKNESSLKAYKTRLKKQMLSLEEAVLTGVPLEAKPVKKTVLDQEAIDIKDRISRLKEENERLIFEEKLKNRTPFQKGLGFVRERIYDARAIKTAFDLSAVLRQGGFIALGHPLRSAKSLPDMIQALKSEKGMQEVNKSIRENPYYRIAQESGLYLAEHGKNTLIAEEAYLSRWSNSKSANWIGVAQSGRAYTAFLNSLRMRSFETMVKAFSKRMDKLPEERELQAIANYINIATGRGSLGKLKGNILLMNDIFFAPRNMISRFQLLTGEPFFHGKALSKDANMVRAMIAEDYGRFLAGVATMYMLGVLAGGEVELEDTNSSDWGKLKFGDTRIDLLTGLQQSLVFISRSSANRLLPSNQDAPRFQDTLFKFFRNKLSPVPGAIVSLRLQKDFKGDPYTLKNVPADILMPMSVDNLFEIMTTEYDIAPKMALSILAILGAGVQNYQEYQKRTFKPYLY